MGVEINSKDDFLQYLKLGKYTIVGSYPLFFYTKLGEAICFDCAREEKDRIAEAITEGSENVWIITGMDINHSTSNYCICCAQEIEY